jgi:hypoxanthine-guanine phosphoribosyltransferase
VELKVALDEMDQQRENVEKRLVDVMEVVEALKSQVTENDVVIVVSVLESGAVLHMSTCCKNR